MFFLPFFGMNLRYLSSALQLHQFCYSEFSSTCVTAGGFQSLAPRVEKGSKSLWANGLGVATTSSDGVLLVELYPGPLQQVWTSFKFFLFFLYQKERNCGPSGKGTNLFGFSLGQSENVKFESYLLCSGVELDSGMGIIGVRAWSCIELTW